MSILILGAGIFGLGAAIELHRRGHTVTVLDPGPVPHPLAASTDISKVVRLEYGPDLDYTVIAERSLEGWRRWNRDLGTTVFHETGVLFLRQSPITPGTFEGDSLSLLQSRNHAVNLLNSDAIQSRFPVWNTDTYPNAIHNPQGGWVESGRTVALLANRALRSGIQIIELSSFSHLLTQGSRATGIETDSGIRYLADLIIAATGAFTPVLFPFTASWFRATAHPVFHLRPDDPLPFTAPRFPVFGADISTTGWYGFPFHPAAGVVKIANHGIGASFDPANPDRAVSQDQINSLRQFISQSLPTLQTAELVSSRLCCYCDTWDGHFWIDRDPERENLLFATGGSGHAFKFAPVLGTLVADAAEAVPNPMLHKFRHRPESKPPRTEESARRQ